MRITDQLTLDGVALLIEQYRAQKSSLHPEKGERDAFMDDVAPTVDRFAVPPTERAEVVAIVESTRADIVV
ncbi:MULTISPECIES: hypothetical protein [unclassified Bradyrhizobium]|uniref:hypothetical protein n=1 Tax=unclassified Bradyrhizobium TaxID=2631580 RepID=UPI00247B23ED|nr:MULTISPECIES: hypothetical protein [unclassified Bradyrhizobium]WGS20607.1 hypothetical protein MTX22_01925 [Bradyrhizobium sp. ISRA463]WGS27497.1 hypothetical protein MTX19_38805 [Bradyrhizobium sp. ISRA464]